MNNLLAVEREDADELVSLRRRHKLRERTKGEKQEEGEEGHSKGEGKEAGEKNGRAPPPYHWEEADRDLAVVLGGSGLDPQPQALEKDDEKAKES